MTNFNRILQLAPLLKERSYFLFGPRATGKSFLIKQQLAESAVIINLLKTEYYLRLVAAPYQLEELILAQLKNNTEKIIVIDEVQKIPLLLNEVHRLIEEKQWKFLLTGSSARKLKHGQANLLAGRARTAELFPLCWAELSDFELKKYLLYGGMPLVVNSNEPWEELQSYVSTYLYEEIQAEGFVRNLPAFSKFLQVAAFCNGQILNYSKIANDVSVSLPTIREYYQILEDTLLGFTLQPWTKSIKRKAQATAKFYLFDLGVTNYLNQIRTVEIASDLFGRALEHWIALELRSYLSYRRIFQPLTFWRSQNHQEVDFLIGDIYAFEVKATQKINQTDLKGLKALAEENQFKRFYCVSNDPIHRVVDGIVCLDWREFIQRLWRDEIIANYN